MAAFANQTSNLSEVSSALSSLSHVFSVSDGIERNSLEEQREYAQSFLDTQEKRVVAVEEHLMTEMKALCQLVEEANRLKLLILKTRLELTGSEKEGDDNHETLETPKQPEAEIHWSVGGHLESVVEEDVETEGATTPGSMLHPSPFYSAPKRKKSLTPTTPKMDSFSFSAGTNSILQNMGISTETDKANKKPDRPNIRMSFSPRHGRMSKSPASYRSDRQLNFDGFREDDDMITLESHSTTAAMSQSGTTISAIDPSEEKSYFIARMESMLEKVEESILESRPSDEIDLSRTSSASPNRTHLSQSQLLEETFDDDSTNVVATQIASENKHQESVGIDKETATQNIRQPRPSHILVNSAIASPAHTNITMDATMMNDTLMSMSALFDDDNLSTVTPILDRYRLDADDNSIGVKVVPNQRGTHSRQSKQVIETIPETPYVYSNGQDGFRSPVGLPGSVSARKKKYRKTPLPKKRVDDDDSFQTWDENDHPNIRVDFGSPHSAISHSKSSTSIFVPPLRPRSLEMRKTLPKTPLSTRAHHSLPGKISNPRTPLTDSYVAKHMTPSRSRISENLDQESMRAIPLSPTPSERSKTFGRESVSSKLDTSGHSFKTDSSRMGKWMEKITMAEYDRAPRVVQMQVNREETNKSLDALEDFLTSNLQESNQTGLEFSEKQGYQVLQKLLGTEQRCKSVLMSLCHWRRLLMYRDNTHGMVFAVNQFEQ